MALQPQQRALAILAGVFGSGLLIAFLAVSVFSGDDETRRIGIGPNQPNTSSSTSPSTTLAPTLPPTTLSPGPPPSLTPSTRITPGTIVILPPSTSPAPTATTAPTAPTTPTTPTTSPPTVAEELEEQLEQLLLGEGTPEPDAPPRVHVTFDKNDFVRVTWALDDTLSEDEQRYAAREEAFALLRAIQGYDRLGDERVIVRATLPDPDTGDALRVVRLEFERATLDALDFDTLDPLSIFEEADEADIDPALEPTPPPTTSTSSTTSTTSP